MKRTLERRAFIKLAGTASGAFALGALAGCGTSSGANGGANGGTNGGANGADAGASPPGSGATDGAADAPVLADPGPKLAARTPASILKGSADEIDVTLNVISGRLPRDLAGHVFVMAALPWGDGTILVNGNGMVYRLDFGSGAVALRTRAAKTACFYADRATRGTSREFKNAGLARMSQSLGVRNEANTAIVPMKDRLLLTFDGGRPHEIDPVSMEIVTPVGAIREWKPALPSLLVNGPFPMHMSTAHPFYDESTGETFLTNYAFGGIPGATVFTDLLRWTGNGALERWSVVLADGSVAEIKESMHQIAVTQDYVVLMDCAFSMSLGELIIPSAPPTAPSKDTIVYVLRRKDLVPGGGQVAAKKVVIPREAAHFVCDYENPGGKITLYLGHANAADPAEWLHAGDVRGDDGSAVRSDLLGMLVTTTDVNAIGKHVIDAEAGVLLDGSILTYDPNATWLPALYTHRGAFAPGRFESMYWCTLGFSWELLTKRVLDLYRDYPYRKLPIANLPKDPQPGALFRLDASTMAIADAYKTPAGRMLLSPQFVPREGSAGGSTDGYVVCTVISDDTSWSGSSGDEIWIFDAKNLAQGPLCRLGHPLLDLPFTLHSTWMKEIAPRTATYKIPAQADFADGLKSQPSDVQQLFANEVFPHFA